MIFKFISPLEAAILAVKKPPEGVCPEFMEMMERIDWTPSLSDLDRMIGNVGLPTKSEPVREVPPISFSAYTNMKRFA